ncbi:MAG TPA: TetR/AcrR family transcriptional regulator [Solirubrobacteraceae bacterium]
MSAQRAATDVIGDPDPGDTAAGEPGGHRERLIAAMAASIIEKGYRDTTVADVVRLARTSRRSFYEHFVDRDACFLALFDATNDAMMEEIAAAVHPDRTLDEQVDSAIDAYIDNVSKQPALYASFVRELPGLGRAGAERGLATLERFAALLVELVDSGRAVRPEIGARPLTMDTAIIIVGGLRELAVISLQRGRDVRELRASAGSTIKAILTGALL